MALFSLNEISEIISDMIRSSIDLGYHIDPNGSSRNDEFKAVLVKVEPKYTGEFIITSSESESEYSVNYSFRFNNTEVKNESIRFYKIKENLYSDNKNEAESMLHQNTCRANLSEETPSIRDMINSITRSNKAYNEQKNESLNNSAHPKYISLGDICNLIFG